jgi:hypothetical protein
VNPLLFLLLQSLAPAAITAPVTAPLCVRVCISLSLSLSLAIFCLPPKFRTLGLNTDLVSLKLKRNFLCRISEVPQFLSRSGGFFFFLLKNKEELLLKKKSGCLELSDGLGWTTTTATTNQQTNNASRLQFYNKERILHGWNSSLAAVVQNR